jgi:CubicO group peptidase (beta-lactamase class C family)
VPAAAKSFAKDFGEQGALTRMQHRKQCSSLAARIGGYALLAVLGGCGGGGDGSDPPRDQNPGLPALVTVTPENTGDGWQVSTPAAEQLDTGQLLKTLEDIRDGAAAGIDSVVVIRHGRLVAEGYFGGFGRESLHDLRSTGKSFVSALAGIAVAQNLLAPDDLISQHIPGFGGHAHMDARKQAIRVSHLLNMTSGLDCDDWTPTSPGWEEKMYDSRDWLKFALDLPMRGEPGTQSSYCTAGVVVLGEVISKASGMPLDAYADMWLLGPLDIHEKIWRRSPDGRATGGTGFRLRPRDAARLGALFANEGLWNGARVVSEDWVRRSRQRVTTLGSGGYGYLWWKQPFTLKGLPVECFHTAGNGGNFIFVFPEQELVVAYTGSNYNVDASDLPLRLVPSILSAVL